MTALARRLRLGWAAAHRGWQRWGPDLRDLHVYGGGILLAWGLSSYWPGAWRVALGLLLLTLGLRGRQA